MFSEKVGTKLLNMKLKKAASAFPEAKVVDKIAAEELRAIEEKILQFCTKPRTSSFVIQLFPSRPFNILAIMENLRVKGLLHLSANKYVTNVEHRDFDVSMTMTAEKGKRSFSSKTEEMWSYSDKESKARLLSKADIISEHIEHYASEQWDFLPPWVQKAVAYEHEHPAILAEVEKEAVETGLDTGYPDRPSIKTIKQKGGQFYADEIEGSGGDWGVFDTEVGHCFSSYSGKREAEEEADNRNREHGLGKYKEKKSEKTQLKTSIGRGGDEPLSFWLKADSISIDSSIVEVQSLQDYDTGTEITSADEIKEAIDANEFNYIVSYKENDVIKKAMLNELHDKIALVAGDLALVKKADFPTTAEELEKAVRMETADVADRLDIHISTAEIIQDLINRELGVPEKEIQSE